MEMESSTSPSGTPAPYGRACLNCSRAKSKCMLLPTGRGCERCQRLKKDCRPSSSVRKRNGRAGASKTAQLEAKLDNIVSLLQTTGSSTTIPAEIWEVANLPSKQPSRLEPNCGGMPSPQLTAPPTPNSSIIDVCNSLPISPEKAQKTIDDFRSINLRTLPIIHIPPNVTSEQLRHDKPFLWLCIMAVTTPGCNEREVIFGRITELIYQEVFIGTCASMDMLQGIMVFISWTTYSKKPFLNFYCHVVMGIICDMGINKAVPKDLSTMQAFKYAVGWRQNNVTTRTLDERRAVLGCFLITSGVALAMSRIDALRWNTYMDECLTVLADTKECPEDEILVNLVKIQLVMDKVYHARRDGEDQFQARIYIKSFESQLDVIRKQIPAHLQHDETVLMYLYCAELVIHEWAIQTPIYPYSPELQRLESLYTALQATKNWLDVWLSFPPDLYHGLPFTLFFQFARNIVSLFRLSTLEDPGWDRNMVRSTANILDIIERIIYNMKKCADMVAEANPAFREFDKGIFDKGMKMMASIKLGWEPKLMEVWYPSLPSNGLNGDDFVPPATDLSNMIPFGLDDAWMMEVFGSL